MARRPVRRRSFGRRRARHVHQMKAVGLPASLQSVSTPVDGGSLRVLGSGEVAFQAILTRISEAKKSVEIRAFLWRDDEAGNQMGEAVLEFKPSTTDIFLSGREFDDVTRFNRITWLPGYLLIDAD